jgi:hypothetical protein
MPIKTGTEDVLCRNEISDFRGSENEDGCVVAPCGLLKVYRRFEVFAATVITAMLFILEAAGVFEK